MTSIKNQFYTAIGIFSFCLLCGFISPFISTNSISAATMGSIELTEVVFTIQQKNPTGTDPNGMIEIQVTQGKAPFKAMLYSTNMPVKEFKFDKNLTIPDLKAGEYMIVVNDSENSFKSSNIKLINK